MNKLTDEIVRSLDAYAQACFLSKSHAEMNAARAEVLAKIEAALAPPAIAGEPVAEDWEDIPDSLIADLLRFAWKREPTLREITAAAKAARPNKEQA